MFENGTYIADRYEVIEKIGTGGMSDVYKALDHSLGREVALKVLKQEFNEDASFVAKFRQEAQAAAGLEHANIVNIYDVGSENGMYYIVMEYVEGITLKTYISKKGQLAYNEVISIAIQVGRGIEAAHKKNIVHRDIKPQNIIISKEGKVKVTDFGIARAASSNTINADIMGSVHYSSPEQARNGYVGFQSDIYSLGIVMYEMITGRVPYDGDTTVAIALQHLQSEMTKPSVYAPNIPISLEKIILKSTMKSQDRRYATMEELLTDLKKALVNPDEDFVNIVDADEADKTRVITDEEVKRIQEEAGLISKEPEKPAKPAKAAKTYDDEYDDDDDDDDEPVNPKMEKAFRIMGIVVAVLIVVLVIYFIGTFLGWFKFGSSKTTTDDTETSSEQVEMVNLLGMTETEAKAALKELGLGYKNAGTASSDTYEEGQIMTQSVDSGDMVDVNTTIKVTISSGAGDVSVPSVAGMTEKAAETTLTDAGFVVSKDYEYSTDVAEGNVISQTPEGDASGKKGDTVTIVISQGTEVVKVPNLVDLTQAEAKEALAAVGLKLGNVTSEYSDTVEEGTVISQSKGDKSYADVGSTIDIVVSKGAEDVYYSYTWQSTFTGYAELADSNGNVVYRGDVVSGNSYSASGITTETGTLTYYEYTLDETTGTYTLNSEPSSSSTVKFSEQ
ncbi:MAG: Stk1 family PASTA domain-containing Ser/Thr kinase [Lachnospiraceae bacterium]|nr:Stk1 family PASTA domain-containing Ser/Thr kinase [Lachnospiraceae bacterium]